ncbi:DUF4843 domain-containing protein [Aestuariibaculum sp. YM273]|uniref:DUF4843 domain-containing protein n=1 Tax=Aestuariibaculum sp. YM273 TaxID=3070659 RepID=UPI0027DC5581|nr:DUF4843 domain-containing protein [Aestuariibaculum sp. YM273]WMI64178.1 DUF4843 domain-containing protein [Aestuariibaculum sp. YM273]
MKNIIKIITVSLSVVLTFLSCGNDEIMSFEGKDVIYYKWAVESIDPLLLNPNYIDSASVAFAYELPEVQQVVYEIPIKVQGSTRYFEREVSVSVSSSSTAQEGVHFTLPDKVVIMADSINGYLPVTLLRTEDMKEKELLVVVKLEENENFNNNLLETRKTNNGERFVSYTEFQITVSDILTQPQYWPTNYLGDYSEKKLYLWAEVLEVPVPDWNSEDPTFDRTFSAAVSVFKQYLTIQELRGTPVLEDDGNPMTLGPYAAYL